MGREFFEMRWGWGGVNWAKSVRKRGRVGDGGITHKPPPQNPSYPLPPTVGIRQSADGAESEGESAYAYKGLPCKDGYIRDVDDVRKKKSPKKKM